MSETKEALWQDKGKRERSKDSGAWVCPNCGQRLATVRFEYRGKSRMCGAKTYDLALLLPVRVDQSEPKRGNFFPAGQHFKLTARHSSRLTHAQDQIGIFSLLKEESHSEANIMEEYEAKGEHIAYFRSPETIKSSINWADAETKSIRRQREPDAPTFVTPDKLPITVECPRTGCNCVAIIRVAVAGEAAKHFKQREEEAIKRTCRTFGITRAVFENEGWGVVPGLAHDPLENL